MKFTTDDLQTILSSLEGYINGVEFAEYDDEELVQKLENICDRIDKKLEVIT